MVRDGLTYISKLLAFGQAAARRALLSKTELVGALIFATCLLMIFTSLWKTIAAEGTPLPLSAQEMLWYVATTEWMMLSATSMYRQIQKDVQQGIVALFLTRPMNYIMVRLAEALGEMVVRCVVLGIGMGTLAAVMTGTMPLDPMRLLGLAPLVFLVAAVVISFDLLFGLLAVWLDDVTAMAWMARKVFFVFGGLMMPLDMYPDWFQQICLASQFPALFYHPAEYLLTGDMAHWSAALMGLLMLLGVVGTALWSLYRLVQANMVADGG